MAVRASTTSWQRALITLTGIVAGVVVVGCLYLARVICIPVALAIFLAFVLGPPVQALQARGFGRTRAVLAVVLLAALLLGGISWGVGSQVNRLLVELPSYSKNLEDKIHSLQNLTKENSLGKMIRSLSEAWNHPEAANDDSQEVANKPTPPQSPAAAAVEPISLPWLGQIPTIFGSVLEGLAKAGLAIVLTIFMLLKREDLRNRFIHLVGRGRLTVTTKAVDDASQRISRYLLMQLLINGTFGLLVAFGLFLIGVKYAFLWGFLIGTLRYVPYVGSTVAALFPVALSLTQFEGWLQPLLVLGLIIVLEFIMTNVAEPRLYGQSIGVSEVGMLVAAAFWAFLWGPIGLVLSGPMTVCLVILGKYVPQLEFFDVLLGDEPALDPRIAFYQRLTAMDQEEASQVVQAYMEKNPPDHVYDDLLVPALIQARRDRDQKLLAEDDGKFIVQAISEIIEDLGNRETASIRTEAAQKLSGEEMPPPVSILGFPARVETDWLGLKMLQQLLHPAKCSVDVMRVEWLSSEMISLVEKRKPNVICIGSMPPGGLAHARYLCKRLRKRYPELKIVVGRWGLKRDQKENGQQILRAGADHMGLTLLETRDHLRSWSPILSQANGAQKSENRPKETVEVPKNGTRTEESKLDKTRRLGRRAPRGKSQSAIGKN